MTLEYHVDPNVNITVLNATCDTIWAELRTDPDLRLQVQKLDISPDDLPETREAAIQLTRKRSGFDPLTTSLLAAFIPVGAKITEQILLDLWKEVILPRIKSKRSVSRTSRPEPIAA